MKKILNTLMMSLLTYLEKMTTGMGTNTFQAVKQNTYLVPKNNNLGGLRVEDRMLKVIIMKT